MQNGSGDVAKPKCEACLSMVPRIHDYSTGQSKIGPDQWRPSPAVIRDYRRFVTVAGSKLNIVRNVSDFRPKSRETIGITQLRENNLSFPRGPLCCVFTRKELAWTMSVQLPNWEWIIGADSDVVVGSTLVPDETKPTEFSTATIPGIVMPCARLTEGTIDACEMMAAHKRKRVLHLEGIEILLMKRWACKYSSFDIRQ
jgi:hypothetical protein